MRPVVVLYLIAAACVAVLTACGATPLAGACRAHSGQVARHMVAEALSRYERLLRAQDSSGLAQMFVPGGRLEHVGQDPIVGRKNIQAFLDSFAQYRVMSHDMNLAASTYTPCHANQSGTYVQHVRTADGQEIVAHGWFLFQWAEQPDGRWLLEFALTSSSPIPGGS